jgi:hypothetical protein
MDRPTSTSSISNSTGEVSRRGARSVDLGCPTRGTPASLPRTTRRCSSASRIQGRRSGIDHERRQRRLPLGGALIRESSQDEIEHRSQLDPVDAHRGAEFLDGEGGPALRRHDQSNPGESGQVVGIRLADRVGQRRFDRHTVNIARMATVVTREPAPAFATSGR